MRSARTELLRHIRSSKLSLGSDCFSQSLVYARFLLFAQIDTRSIGARWLSPLSSYSRLARIASFNHLFKFPLHFICFSSFSQVFFIFLNKRNRFTETINKEVKMIIANIIAFILVLVGALNWGLVGIFSWNLVEAIFGLGLTVGARIIYILVFTAALWLIFYAVYSLGRIDMKPRQNRRDQLK